MKEIGELCYILKVDGTRDCTGMENVSIIIHFFNEDMLAITERLLVMTTSELGDAHTLTNVICSELTNAGLTMC